MDAKYNIHYLTNHKQNTALSSYLLGSFSVCRFQLLSYNLNVDLSFIFFLNLHTVKYSEFLFIPIITLFVPSCKFSSRGYCATLTFAF